MNLSAAEKRYDRVRRWTKKVNIFEKDFVIVPINEHSHWFVAVICYPGLVGKRRMDNNEVIPVRARFEFPGQNLLLEFTFSHLFWLFLLY